MFLDEFFFCNLDESRKARRGAVLGPSGMTSDHFFPLLESEVDPHGWVPCWLGSAHHSGGHQVGAFDSPQQARRGVRGIVVGDILVAQTMAKQFSKKVEADTALFQYALSTKGQF